MNSIKKAVVILSGGMDSTLSAKIAQNRGYDLIGLHFSYGQITEKKELKCYQEISKYLNIIKSYEINLDFFKQIQNSSLLDKNIKIPESGINKNIIPNTYVSFRNGIFLSIATAIAEKYNAEAIFIGVVEEDSSGYPDCRENYIRSMEKSINLGTAINSKISIKRPLISLSKKNIVEQSIKLGIPLEKTWSCYKNEDMPCGLCDSCRLRNDAFNSLNIKIR